jgi:hypothetical protein
VYCLIIVQVLLTCITDALHQAITTYSRMPPALAATAAHLPDTSLGSLQVHSGGFQQHIWLARDPKVGSALQRSTTLLTLTRTTQNRSGIGVPWIKSCLVNDWSQCARVRHCF